MGLGIWDRNQKIDELAEKPDQLALPTQFTIEELGGQKRIISMTGWALPLRPVEMTTAQRLMVEYYPGATEAVAQVFGPDFTGQTFKGVWVARYLGDIKHPIMEIKKPGEGKTYILYPEQARAEFQSLCKEGQELIVSWGQDVDSTQQRGFLKHVKFIEHNPTRIEWELEFIWVSDTRLKPKEPKFPEATPKPKNIFDKINDLLNTLQQIMNDASDAYRDYVDTYIRQFNTLLSRVGDLVNQTLSFAALPTEVAKNIIQVCQNCRQLVEDIETQSIITAKFYQQLGEIGEYTFTGGQSWLGWSATQDRSSQSASAQAETALIYSQLQEQKNDLIAETKKQEEQARKFLQQTYLDVYVVHEGDTLRKIAAKYYGDAGLWQSIAEANDLKGDIIEAGMILLIPKIGT
jgi:LysM repeat protein